MEGRRRCNPSIRIFFIFFSGTIADYGLGTLLMNVLALYPKKSNFSMSVGVAGK
jgi:hypothetical protein